MPASGGAPKYISKKKIARALLISRNQQSAEFRACCPHAGRAVSMKLLHGFWPRMVAVPKITLRHVCVGISLSHLLPDRIPIQIWQLTCDKSDVKRPTMVSKREKQILRTQPESVPVSGLHAVGSWTRDLKPLNKRNVVPTDSGSESLELSPIDPAGHPTLIFVWTLQ